uniref:Uncharacterized protein n=1 Tax=Rhizophora mucronata TaxID=61149 RepID=A0A2P2J0X0_RHIMU
MHWPNSWMEFMPQFSITLSHLYFSYLSLVLYILIALYNRV